MMYIPANDFFLQLLIHYLLALYQRVHQNQISLLSLPYDLSQDGFRTNVRITFAILVLVFVPYCIISLFILDIPYVIFGYTLYHFWI